LAFIKASKEIEGIDFAHLKEILGMQQMLKQSEQVEEAEEAPAGKNVIGTPTGGTPTGGTPTGGTPQQP